MLNYTHNPSDLEEIKKDKLRWLIHHYKLAIDRLPKSPYNVLRRQTIIELEKKL